jgi:uncharacterized SAM-binding protein YcdF (DUF218 family)
MAFFIFKKLVALLVTPLGISLLLMFIGLFYFFKKPTRSFIFLISGIATLTLSALPPVADYFLRPIEYAYPTFAHSEKPVDYIAVLGCHHTNNELLPVTSQLRACSLKRITEAVRIANIHPEAIIITSGYFGKKVISHAEKVRQAAIALGINQNRVIVADFAKDTEEEAQQIALHTLGKNLVLVSSASHMIRAMKYFELTGVTPIPAPAGHLSHISSGKDNHNFINYGYYIPSTRALEKTGIALYERLSMLWQWIKS